MSRWRCRGKRSIASVNLRHCNDKDVVDKLLVLFIYPLPCHTRPIFSPARCRCPGQLQNASWVAWFKSNVQFGAALLPPVKVSAYTLMQMNGWGEGGSRCQQLIACVVIEVPRNASFRAHR